MSDPEWAVVMEQLREEMTERHRGREEALTLCRQVIQFSSKAIRAIHRHEFDTARQLLDQTKGLVSEMQAALAPFPELAHSGYRSDAEKEFVEAEAVLSMVQKLPLPAPSKLEVMMAAYLNGMAEASSECRRYVLDLMRSGEMAEAERLLGVMEDIYDELITFDFPDVLTGGLRRTCDALRAVLERTRSDLTVTSTQRELLNAVRTATERFGE